MMLGLFEPKLSSGSDYKEEGKVRESECIGI